MNTPPFKLPLRISDFMKNVIEDGDGCDFAQFDTPEQAVYLVNVVNSFEEMKKALEVIESINDSPHATEAMRRTGEIARQTLSRLQEKKG